ncbi:hypothetical protein ACFC09_10340 [Streptomyces sp. NPDC056161]|uniref:hypothetical protein n=1 Tax=Streptomyces sp. NPDC056161 TaxID=3345732 RepID=UPI0035DC3144
MDHLLKKYYLELQAGGLQSSSERLRADLSNGLSAAKGAKGEVDSLVKKTLGRQGDLDRQAASLGTSKEAPEMTSHEAIHARAADRAFKPFVSSLSRYERSNSKEDGEQMINHGLVWASLKEVQQNLMEKRLEDLSEQNRAALYAPMHQAVEVMQGVAAWFSGQARNPVGGAARATQPPVPSAAATRGRPQLAGSSTVSLPYRPADKPKGPTR